MELNHKLIYEAQPLHEEMMRTGRAISSAKDKAEAAKKAWEEWCTKKAGTEIRITNEGCIARGVLYHVYKPKEGVHLSQAGSGRNVCIFCGIDDFDY